MQLAKNIEAILFYKGEATKKSELAKILDVSKEEVQTAIGELRAGLEGRGVMLMEKGDEVMLGTDPESAVLIESMVKDELDKSLGKAGLETLSVVLYRGPIARSEIDYVRGVNSSYILRNLLVRGLIERVGDKKGKGFFYQPTFQLLSYMGVGRVEDLPQFEKVNAEFENTVLEQKEDDGEE